MKLTSTTHDLGHGIVPLAAEHLIGFVDDSILDASHREDVRLVHQVLKTARGTDEEVAALAKLLKVDTDRNSAVRADRTKHGAITKATSLVEDLLSQLAGRDNDNDKGLGTDAATVDGARSLELANLTHQFGDDRNKVCGGLARASLGNSDKIVASHNDRNAVSLNDGGVLVVAHLHVGKDLGVKTSILKL
jgi:hypothetical protein